MPSCGILAFNLNFSPNRQLTFPGPNLPFLLVSILRSPRYHTAITCIFLSAFFIVQPLIFTSTLTHLVIYCCVVLKSISKLELCFYSSVKLTALLLDLKLPSNLASEHRSTNDSADFSYTEGSICTVWVLSWEKSS